MADSISKGVSYADPLLQSITFSNATNIQFVVLDTAITANTTLTSLPASSIAITSNATGKGYLYMSDGSKWQYAKVA